MANEDFTTYTESDPDGLLSQTSARSTYASLSFWHDTWLYKDYGAGHFNATFRHNFDYRANADPVLAHNFWGIMNNVNSENYNAVNGFPQLLVGIQDWNAGLSKYDFLLQEQWNDGTQHQSYIYTGFNYSVNTTYYLQVYYNPAVGTYGTIYLYVYPTDADRTAGTNVIDTVSRELHAAISYRYLIAIQQYTVNGGTTPTVSGYIENLDLSASAPPTSGLKNKSTLLLMGVG